MTAHRVIMTEAAKAVRDSAEVIAYCKSNFRRGLDIHVGAYAQGIPSQNDAPFLWIYADGQNESVSTDETFTVRFCLGACVTAPNGDKKIGNVITERTVNANGLTVNGGNKTVEDLRDLILGIVRNAKAGARVQRIRRTENDFSHFPLEWAEFEVEYAEDISLAEIGG